MPEITRFHAVWINIVGLFQKRCVCVH